MQTFSSVSRETRGLWLGALGVLIFALTLPMTRLATGSVDSPQLSGVFIAMGRATLAGVLSLIWLLWARPSLPSRRDGWWLMATAVGTVFGFPLCTSIALRHVESVHASVMLGVLPLATAALGAWVQRHRPSWGFWVCAVLGAAMVLTFAVLRSGVEAGVAGGKLGLHALHWADWLLLLAMGFAAVSYVSGAQLSLRMPAEQVICWALVISLPVTLPAALWLQPTHWAAIAPAAWGGFLYVSLFSMWMGFFAWYRGLAMGGTVRVSQVQLVMPFLSMLFSVPLLGERLDLMTVLFGLAVVLTVAVGKFMPIRTVVAPTPLP